MGGRFDKRSFASSYPAEEQIYLEEVWNLSSDGKFETAVERSQGVIVSCSEILAVEFFQNEVGL